MCYMKWKVLAQHIWYFWTPENVKVCLISLCPFKICFTILKKYAGLCFVFVSVGDTRVGKPSLLHDTCDGRMFIRLHAASVHAAQLHRLHIRTPDGQRHGNTSAPVPETHCYLPLPNFMSVPVFSGKNRLCHEHSGCLRGFSGYEHMGHRHV